MSEFNHRKWFKKQYLEEGMSDEDKVVAATKDGRIEITQKQMERLHNGEVVRLSNGSVLSFVKEGHTEDKTREINRARIEAELEKNPNYKKDSETAEKVRAMLAKERPLKEDDLNEINRDTFNMMEGTVNKETYKRFIDSLDDLLDDWYMEGFEKSDVIDFMEAIIPSN